jgi:putative copper export protein
MKTLDWETVRLFLHVLAATVWVGGQLTLAALVPALRGTADGVTKVAARAFNRVAWPAFGVLVLTGIWNVVALDDEDPAFQHTLVLKYALVLVSGVTAYAHQRSTTRAGLAVFGALTAVSALGALFVGVWLAE